MDFSLFYFGDDADDSKSGYRLLLDGARFADESGFTAVWTPERHFHSFGGLFPNPSVTGAAVAAVTSRIAVRAGSVVAPLHHPVRIAEEWSVVDNISDGRAGVSFASGWNAADFVLQPDSFLKRKQLLIDAVSAVRTLWRGDELTATDGTGEARSVRLHPKPVQRSLPLWLTSGGSVDTFVLAGELGAGILTHLLGQEIEALGEKIAAYRQAWRPGPDSAMKSPHVVLMLHSFLGDDRDEVRELVREPLVSYLANSFSLFSGSPSAASPQPDSSGLRAHEIDFLVRRSFDRYFDTSGLFGTVEDGLRLLARIAAIGVDEVACLIDFGVAPDVVLGHLGHLADLKDRA